MNTAEGLTRLLRQHGPRRENGVQNYAEKEPQIIFTISFFQLYSPSFTVNHGPLCSESRGSIKILRNRRFDPPVTMATFWVPFLCNFCQPSTILSCISSVLKCPLRFCISTLTSKGADEWHARTKTQREEQKRPNLCLFPAARPHWYHAQSGRVCTDPWQHSGGRDSLIRYANSPASLELRVKDVVLLEGDITPQTSSAEYNIFLAYRQIRLNK